MAEEIKKEELEVKNETTPTEAKTEENVEAKKEPKKEKVVVDKKALKAQKKEAKEIAKLRKNGSFITDLQVEKISVPITTYKKTEETKFAFILPLFDVKDMRKVHRFISSINGIATIYAYYRKVEDSQVHTFLSSAKYENVNLYPISPKKDSKRRKYAALLDFIHEIKQPYVSFADYRWIPLLESLPDGYFRDYDLLFFRMAVLDSTDGVTKIRNHIKQHAFFFYKTELLHTNLKKNEPNLFDGELYFPKFLEAVFYHENHVQKTEFSTIGGMLMDFDGVNENTLKSEEVRDRLNQFVDLMRSMLPIEFKIVCPGHFFVFSQLVDKITSTSFDSNSFFGSNFELIEEIIDRYRPIYGNTIQCKDLETRYLYWKINFKK